MTRLKDGENEYTVTRRTEWGFGWDEPAGPVRMPASDEEQAGELAQRAGGRVFVREVFETEWVDAPK